MLKWLSTLGLNWKLWAIALAIGFTAGNITGFKMGGVWQGWACSREKDAIAEAAVDNQKITKGANDDLQQKYNAINNRLIALKRVRQPSCIMPVASASKSSTSGAGYAGKNGVTVESLRDYAAECEKYRQERIALEHFQSTAWQLVSER